MRDSILILGAAGFIGRHLAQALPDSGHRVMLATRRPEALAHPNLVSRGMIQRDEIDRRHIGPPIRFSHEPARPNLHEPALGEHTSLFLKNAPASE